VVLLHEYVHCSVAEIGMKIQCTACVYRMFLSAKWLDMRMQRAVAVKEEAKKRLQEFVSDMRSME